MTDCPICYEPYDDNDINHRCHTICATQGHTICRLCSIRFQSDICPICRGPVLGFPVFTRGFTTHQTPVQTPVQTPAQEPVQTPVQEPVQTPVQEPVQTPVQEPMWKTNVKKVYGSYANITDVTTSIFVDGFIGFSLGFIAIMMVDRIFTYKITE